MPPTLCGRTGQPVRPRVCRGTRRCYRRCCGHATPCDAMRCDAMRCRQVYEAQLETKLEADRMAAMLEQACHAVLMSTHAFYSTGRIRSRRTGRNGHSYANSRRRSNGSGGRVGVPVLVRSGACMYALRCAPMSRIPSLLACGRAGACGKREPPACRHPRHGTPPFGVMPCAASADVPRPLKPRDDAA